MIVLNPRELTALVKSLAREEGFELAGVARAGASAYGDFYRQWIEAGKHGAMEYLAKGMDERLDLTRKFPWARSVLCVGLAYFQEAPEEAGTATPEAMGKIARYAWGRDYHKVVEAKLRRVEARVREMLPEVQIRNYCDTGPLLEREFAMRAGLGWVGKHTLLINPRHGSWFVLGEMVLSADLEPDGPETDHCGSCRRCIEACPTQAIAPYTVDGSKCISYLTLENRGTIPPEFHGAVHDAGFVAGCDICQEVCPFNRDPLETQEPDFALRSPAPGVSLQEILRWNEQEWDIYTRGRAFRRAKYEMWRRNAQIIAENGDNNGRTVAH